MDCESGELGPRTHHSLADIVESTRRDHRLFHVLWEVTHRCALSCAHCCIDLEAGRRRAEEELSTTECFRVVDQLAEMGVLKLTLTGGDPFARSDFLPILGHARQARFLVRIFTNGLAVTEEVADRIAALHIAAVEISVYAAHPDIHDRITGRTGSWERSIAAVRRLRDRGVRVAIKTPLMKPNFRELDRLRELARTLGAGFRWDPTLTDRNDGTPIPEWLRLESTDLVEIFEATISPRQWLDRNTTADQPVCAMGLNHLVIDPWGTAFPCVQTRIPIASVRSTLIRTIWEDLGACPQGSRITLDQLPRCRTCEQQRFCVRCHGLAWLETGELTAPSSVACREALARREALRAAGWLTAVEP